MVYVFENAVYNAETDMLAGGVECSFLCPSFEMLTIPRIDSEQDMLFFAVFFGNLQ